MKNRTDIVDTAGSAAEEFNRQCGELRQRFSTGDIDKESFVSEFELIMRCFNIESLLCRVETGLLDSIEVEYTYGKIAVWGFGRFSYGLEGTQLLSVDEEYASIAFSCLAVLAKSAFLQLEEREETRNLFLRFSPKTFLERIAKKQEEEKQEEEKQASREVKEEEKVA